VRTLETMSHRRLALFALLLWAPCLIWAQGDGREGRASGSVLSARGLPIADARVRLEAADGFGGAVSAVTGGDGRWSRGDLAPRVWSVSIEADGYRQARGSVEITSGGSATLEVVLEADPDVAVQEWLRQGNILLESGVPGAAQAFYEQAISVVFGPQVAPIHKALARAHFLQDRVDEAVQALQMALLTDPSDTEARTLVRGVLSGAGREAEAVEWLRVLDQEGLAAAARRAFGTEVPEFDLSESPTGRFRAALRPGPHSDIDRLLTRIGSWEELGVEEGSSWTTEGESFEVYVPEGGSEAEPYGIFVWVSPTARGSVTDREMIPLLDAERMIWIGANQAGNPRPRGDRIRLALDAAAALEGAYPIDSSRVYVGGYSGGGRTASTLALHYPEVFTGGVYFMGVDFYRNIAVPDQPGKLWGAVLKPPSEEARQLIRDRSRFVFITGTYDFNRAQTHAYRDEYLGDGLGSSIVIEIPDVGHYYGFRAAELETALKSLDGAADL